MFYSTLEVAHVDQNNLPHMLLMVNEDLNDTGRLVYCKHQLCLIAKVPRQTEVKQTFQLAIKTCSIASWKCVMKGTMETLKE